MSLNFNLRHLEARNLELEGELTPEELELTGIDEMITVRQPVSYELTLERLNASVLARGTLACTLECQCVRCLRTFTKRLELDDWTCDLPLEGEEKAAVHNDCIDLTPYLREDILLAFPQHPLCEPGCRGLLDRGHNLNEPASIKEQAVVSSAWAELNKLKL
jgi:uncharacterized protein